MGLNMSLVFKLGSIEDLGKLYEAMKQAQTLQEKIKLENELKDLSKRRDVLQSELKGLKQEINKLSPSEKLSELKDTMKELEEETSSFDRDRETLADEVMAETEDTEPQPAEEEQTEGASANDERFIVEEREGAVQEEERPTDV